MLCVASLCWRGLLLLCGWLGALIFVAARFYDLLYGVEAAEFSAILLGLQWALSLNLAPVAVESDALNMVRLCCGFSFSYSNIDNIIQDVRFLLERHSFLSICFVSRLGNNVAHCVSKWAVGNPSSCCFDASFPAWLLKLARGEVVSGFVAGSS
ncbi:hypothetical protein ACOSQ3_019082 [Xanthoceras sorbifolium]